jgi:hypothetical protein
MREENPRPYKLEKREEQRAEFKLYACGHYPKMLQNVAKYRQYRIPLHLIGKRDVVLAKRLC